MPKENDETKIQVYLWCWPFTGVNLRNIIIIIIIKSTFYFLADDDDENQSSGSQDKRENNITSKVKETGEVEEDKDVTKPSVVEKTEQDSTEKESLNQGRILL